MNEYYTINDIATMTGLTTRTVRNYIKLGLLDGEKMDGIWQFSIEAVSAFMADKNPKVFLHMMDDEAFLTLCFLFGGFVLS